MMAEHNVFKAMVASGGHGDHQRHFLEIQKLLMEQVEIFEGKKKKKKKNKHCKESETWALVMTRMRHPHTVQFLRLRALLDEMLEDVYDFSPIVMQSLVADVVRALFYLHACNPPIVHRDLIPHKTPFVSSLVAKTKELKNACIIEPRPDQLYHMACEVFDVGSRYNPKPDIFSFGHLSFFCSLQTPLYKVKNGRRCTVCVHKETDFKDNRATSNIKNNWGTPLYKVKNGRRCTVCVHKETDFKDNRATSNIEDNWGKTSLQLADTYENIIKYLIHERAAAVTIKYKTGVYIYLYTSLYLLNLLLLNFPVHAQNVCTPVSCIRTSVSLALNTTNPRNPPFACRGEQLQFMCEVLNGLTLQWASEPAICRDTPISYTTGDNVGEQRQIDIYQSRLISVARRPPSSNFTSSLTVTPPTSVNSVTVVCGNQLPFCTSTETELTLSITAPPMVPQGSLQYFISSQENCPSNVSVLIQFDEIPDVATLTYQLSVSSSDGCALQECPMLLSPRQRTLTVTLLGGIDYTATLEVSNDCGSGSTTVPIRPMCEIVATDPPQAPSVSSAGIAAAAAATAAAVAITVAIVTAALVFYNNRKKRSPRLANDSGLEVNRKQTLDEREQELEKREQELEKREQELEKREQELEEREQKVKRREQQLEREQSRHTRTQ